MFAEQDKPLKRVDLVQYRLNTGDAQPIRQVSRRLALARQEQVEKMVKDMREQSIIEVSIV